MYRSRAHRDRVNAKVMKDPRIARMVTNKNNPFDMKRMLYVGFKVLVDVAPSHEEHCGAIAPCTALAK